MLKMMECLDDDCTGPPSIHGHHQQCPTCGSLNISNYQSPENAKDMGIARDDYNRRNMHTPGFVPSVEYIVDPTDPTKTIPKPTES
jgi:hypothetical protein